MVNKVRYCTRIKDYWSKTPDSGDLISYHRWLERLATGFRPLKWDLNLPGKFCDVTKDRFFSGQWVIKHVLVMYCVGIKWSLCSVHISSLPCCEATQTYLHVLICQTLVTRSELQ